MASTGYSFKKLYPDRCVARSRRVAGTAHNPALLVAVRAAVRQLGRRADRLAVGGSAALGAALMSIFIVIRHTRADEETGRLELVGSTAVGRHAALAAGLMLAAGANIVLAVLITAALTAVGPARRRLDRARAGHRAAAGWSSPRWPRSPRRSPGRARGARGIAIAVLGVAYLLRAVGDLGGARAPRWLTWLSPIGWAELIQAVRRRPLVGARAAGRWPRSCWPPPRPCWPPAAIYGAGLLPPRPGPAAAAAALRSPLALAWRLQRGSLVGWVHRARCRTARRRLGGQGHRRAARQRARSGRDHRPARRSGRPSPTPTWRR